MQYFLLKRRKLSFGTVLEANVSYNDSHEHLFMLLGDPLQIAIPIN